MPPVRVAFPIDNLGIGGTETNMFRVATRLVAGHVSVLVLYSRPGPLLERLQSAGIPVRRFPQPGLRSLRLRGAVRAFRQLLVDERIDVVHTHDVYSNTFAALAHRPRERTRLLVSRRWGATHYGRLLSWANRRAYHCADAVLGNSEGVARSLELAEGVPRAKIVVVPNFADAAAFAPPPATRDAMRDELEVPREALVVGCIANLIAVKNHALLLRAVAGLPALSAPVHLVCIGDGPLRAELVSLAASLGLADRVHFTGTIVAAGRFHHAFDLSTLTSNSEGFPNTLVEAMAARRPTVATEVGGVSDAVEDGVTGYLVPRGDARALAGRLGALLANPGLRTQFGEAGRRRADTHFHPDVVIPHLEATYQALIDRRPVDRASQSP